MTTDVAAPEVWDPGLVKYVITKHDGTEIRQEQACWHRGRFIEKQWELAEQSQRDKDKKARYTFTIAGA